MDQSLSLPARPSASSGSASLSSPEASSAQAGTAAGSTTDEDPGSPGRSPRPDTGAGVDGAAELTVGDPLAEGLGLLAGAAIALISLVVPVAAVVCDPAAPPPPLPPRAAF